MTRSIKIPANLENGGRSFEDVQGLTRSGSYLYPLNRRLRHLQGVHFRNLSLVPPRLRRKTIDDDSLLSNFLTSTKSLSLFEISGISHSKSATDLKKAAKEVELEDKYKSHTSDETWHPENFDDMMADIFFTIHIKARVNPIYVSEVIEHVRNPSWKFFNLNDLGSDVSRLDIFTIKFWTMKGDPKVATLLLEQEVHLGSLHFIGKSLEDFHRPLPANTVILQLTDGIYTNFTGLLFENQKDPSFVPLPPIDGPLTGSSHKSTIGSARAEASTAPLDSCLQLKNLHECIQDAFATARKTTGGCNELLRKNKAATAKLHCKPAKENAVVLAQAALDATNVEISTLKEQIKEKKAQIQSRKMSIAQGYAIQKKAELIIQNAKSNPQGNEHKVGVTTEGIGGQRRRIAAHLHSVFKIRPIADKPLCFTILGHYLPNGDFSNAAASPASTAAALGHVAFLVDQLSLYLMTMIPYPITSLCSCSTILDPISIAFKNNQMRTFPLYEEGVPAWRFEYAAYLLNKDLGALMAAENIRMLDIRYTLPNIKYLLEHLISGNGDMPTREAGAVEGLKAKATANADQNLAATVDAVAKHVASAKRVGDASGSV